jgi:hypothetical protein
MVGGARGGQQGAMASKHQRRRREERGTAPGDAHGRDACGARVTLGGAARGPRRGARVSKHRTSLRHLPTSRQSHLRSLPYASMHTAQEALRNGVTLR